MFRRRRRKTRVTWLPNTGTPYSGTFTPGEQSCFIEQNIGFALGGGNDPTLEIPLVLDNQNNILAAGSMLQYQQQTLAEDISYGYRLRRIVGEMFVGVSIPSGGDPAASPPAVVVGAGLMVRRVDEQNNSVVAGEQLTPLAISQVTDPWIWRRTWLLGVGGSAPGTNPGDAAMRALMASLPQFNFLSAQSSLSGTHVDAKTARRISREERLFLDFSVRSVGGELASVANLSFYCLFDYRVLGTVIPASGNRRNASR